MNTIFSILDVLLLVLLERGLVNICCDEGVGDTTFTDDGECDSVGVAEGTPFSRTTGDFSGVFSIIIEEGC